MTAARYDPRLPFQEPGNNPARLFVLVTIHQFAYAGQIRGDLGRCPERTQLRERVARCREVEIAQRRCQPFKGRAAGAASASRAGRREATERSTTAARSSTVRSNA